MRVSGGWNRRAPTGTRFPGTTSFRPLRGHLPCKGKGNGRRL